MGSEFSEDFASKHEYKFRSFCCFCVPNTYSGASGVRDFETVSFQICKCQAGLLLNIILKPSSVKDGLTVVEQGVAVKKPRPPGLHFHFVVCPLFNLN